jgi:asparagine synthase (glutamine-hydrolysing)
MCGICGFIDYTFRSNVEVLNYLLKSLQHRGPDDKGCDVYFTNYALIGLGHSRLSILDISSAGHQPMHYNHLTIALNGEIYNFKEIRSELSNLGHTFNSESDTEVVIQAFAKWGVSCVSKFIGMFVFVIFNKNSQEITIVRDRAGVKPLFYYWHNNLFLFASELKAFHQHPHFLKRINLNAVHQYMDFGYVPSPYCIFENCHKLNPGHYLTFRIDKKEFKITKYWDINDYYCLPNLNISYTEAKQEVEKLLHSAFEYRMVSDVPVGVFLSGGYDSTAVTSILQSHRTSKLKTFTIGFEEGNNEAPFAKQIANYIGTEHTEYYCKASEAKEIIPTLPYFYDEPFADPSAIPTILVSKLARTSVTVALSADAGDEIFAGYDNYVTYVNNLAVIKKIPPNLRNIVSWISRIGTSVLPENFLNQKLTVLSKILKTNEIQIPQVLLRNYFVMNKSIKKDLFCSSQLFQKTVYDEDFSRFKDNLSVALATDFSMYLQNAILVKVDRATMSVSLEGREPLLDHRIVEFAAQLPSNFKYGQTQKMILKDIVYKYVPKQLLDRPKAGFSIPVHTWLKDDLSYLLEENMNLGIIAKSGLFNQVTVQKLVSRFMHDKLYDPNIIWKLLQFQMWFNLWMK